MKGKIRKKQLFLAIMKGMNPKMILLALQLGRHFIGMDVLIRGRRLLPYSECNRVECSRMRSRLFLAPKSFVPKYGGGGRQLANPSLGPKFLLTWNFMNFRTGASYGTATITLVSRDLVNCPCNSIQKVTGIFASVSGIMLRALCGRYLSIKNGVREG